MMRNCSFSPSQQIETWTRFKNGKADWDTAMRASFSKATQKFMNEKKCQNAKDFLRFSLSWFSIYNIWMRCLVFWEMSVNLRYELRVMMKKDSAQMLALPWYLHVQTNLVLLNLDFTGYPNKCCFDLRFFEFVESLDELDSVWCKISIALHLTKFHEFFLTL